ncbi:MAG: hypothetical protein NC548_35320, partial [Lachnospiraceae bacterium]|nr:hypothetical protein [Lachnospiraceae bacterium]
LKEAIDLANYAKHEEIPPKAKSDYLISLYRVAVSIDYRARLDGLITKKGGSNPYAENNSTSGVLHSRNHLPNRVHRR